MFKGELNIIKKIVKREFRLIDIPEDLFCKKCNINDIDLIRVKNRFQLLVQCKNCGIPYSIGFYLDNDHENALVLFRLN